MADISIYSVAFPPGGVEISYAEERDFGEVAALQRTLVVRADLVGELLSEIIELVQEVVDKGLTAMPDYVGDIRPVKRTPREAVLRELT